jgi:chaperonin GroES
MNALYNAVIVKPLENQETLYGNIIVPDIENNMNKVGIVVDVGPGHYSITGNLIPTQLKIGAKVVLPTMGFTRFIYEGQEYWVGRENECLCEI